jgi:tetratricopeptide (TPR) repeat protein
MLEWMADNSASEEVVGLAHSVESLIAYLGTRQVLAKVDTIRENAARRLGEWGHAQFSAEYGTINQQIERGDLQATIERAQQLLERCIQAGEEAFPQAAYDIALAHHNLGRVHRMAGNAEVALESLSEAERRFQALASAGNTDAERMSCRCFSGSSRST